MTDRSAHNILMSYPFYREGTQKLRDGLLKSVHILDSEEFNDGHLFRTGDLCESICLVGSGNIRVYVSGISGRGVMLYNVGSGELCPINVRMALAGTTALANATASIDLVALWLHSWAVRDLSSRFPEFRDFVQQSVIERFEEIILRISDITTRRVDQRLVELLLHEFSLSTYARPTIEMTQEEIALTVGAAREVVSRKLQEFERIEAVKLGRGRIWLADIERLNALMAPKKRAS